MEITVRIEIPRGSRNKYEVDERTGAVRLDRVLYSSYHYPTDYGFVPESLAEDGDALDALVVVHEPTVPGCLVQARPVGVLHMRDEKGGDDKIIAVPLADPRFAEVRSLSDLEAHRLREIENFFATYKLLEDKRVELLGWGDAEEAHAVIEAAFTAYTARSHER